MGSKTFDGVRFSVFSNDHHPPHVHGTMAGVTVILDLLKGGEIRLADRTRPIVPPNAPQNIIGKIRRAAAENVDELFTLWEKTHGTR